MTSPKPRELANEYGKTIDEMFSKIEVEDSFKEKEIQKKKNQISWKGLDGPFIGEEIKLHRDFFEFMIKVCEEEKNLKFKFSDLENLYKNDKEE